MPDYKEMYYTLFRAHAKVIALLEQAEKKTEVLYINSKDPVAFVDIETDMLDNE